MSWFCERFPLIAKALLNNRRPWDLAKIERLSAEQRNGYEELTEVININA